jgi:hypothetical protein
VKEKLDRWLADREVSEEQRQQIEAIWSASADEKAAVDPSTNLANLVESAAIVWPAAAEVVSETRLSQGRSAFKQFAVLKLVEPKQAAAKPEQQEAEETEEEPAAEEAAEQADESAESENTESAPEAATEKPAVEEATAEEATEEEATEEETTEPEQAQPQESPEEKTNWIVSNLRLHYARWLAQQEMYDESLELIETLASDQVVDPASLLFYQSAAYHFLLNKSKGLATIDKLLENEESIARRYSITAKLMAADLKPLKADSLDEVARMMGDIERRLRLQRAGTRVRKEEDDVVAKLDKMIEELEKQQQQQQQSGAGAGNSNNPSSPMQDSQIGGASGEGNVDPKRLDNRENWGNLPPKERQEALQQITKELPAHYREAVEEYFRKLARDGVNP